METILECIIQYEDSSGASVGGKERKRIKGKLDTDTVLHDLKDNIIKSLGLQEEALKKKIGSVFDINLARSHKTPTCTKNLQ